MIYYINGKLEHKSPDKIIVDINGIGYQIFIPLSTYQKLPDKNEIVKIYTYCQIREDIINIFGFYSLDEKELFENLISVSSVGPRIAINILSQISAEDFKKAILKADINTLTNISGIGKKTAQRLVIELKDKIGNSKDNNVSFLMDIMDSPKFEEAINALVALGYKQNEAGKAVINARKILGDNVSIEIYIKQSLKYLAKIL